MTRALIGSSTRMVKISPHLPKKEFILIYLSAKYIELWD